MQQATKKGPILDWPQGDVSNVPYSVFIDPDVYTLEQERVFRGPTWNYVGLEAEIPGEGDYRTTHIGEVPVILCRDKMGGVNVLVNRCSHRGALVLREAFGCRKRFNCVYHQWGYDPTGELKAVPFKGGVDGEGGYDPSFCMSDHGLTRLRVETLNGLVFATFRQDTVPLAAYLGKTLPHVTRVFDGRPLVVLGYLRQRVRANWKLYFENTKDLITPGCSTSSWQPSGSSARRSAASRSPSRTAWGSSSPTGRRPTRTRIATSGRRSPPTTGSIASTRPSSCAPTPSSATTWPSPFRPFFRAW